MWNNHAETSALWGFPMLRHNFTLMWTNRTEIRARMRGYFQELLQKCALYWLANSTRVYRGGMSWAIKSWALLNARCVNHKTFQREHGRRPLWWREWGWKCQVLFLVNQTEVWLQSKSNQETCWSILLGLQNIWIILYKMFQHLLVAVRVLSILCWASFIVLDLVIKGSL